MRLSLGRMEEDGNLSCPFATGWGVGVCVCVMVAGTLFAVTFPHLLLGWHVRGGEETPC